MDEENKKTWLSLA